MIGKLHKQFDLHGTLGVATFGDEDEDSFRTPLNHAGIYGLFLTSQIAGQNIDPFTEWALNWLSEYIQERPDPPTEEGEATAFIAEVREWVDRLVDAARERVSYLGSLDNETSATGVHGQGTSLTEHYDDHKGSDATATNHFFQYAERTTGPADGEEEEWDSGAHVDSVSSLFHGGRHFNAEDQSQAEADDETSLTTPPAQTIFSDQLAADAFVFAPLDASSTAELGLITTDIDLTADIALDMAPLDDTALLSEPLVADPVMGELASAEALVVPTLETTIVTSFVNADDFIV